MNQEGLSYLLRRRVLQRTQIIYLTSGVPFLGIITILISYIDVVMVMIGLRVAFSEFEIVDVPRLPGRLISRVERREIVGLFPGAV